MATLGRIQKFDPKEETIEAYLERVQLFIQANGIKDKKRVAVHLSVLGSKPYRVLTNVLAPQKPSEKSYNELTRTLRSHFNPKPVVIAERFHFHRRVQSAEESLTEYVAELKKLAQSCNFGGHLDEVLRDRLVCGIRSQGAQRRLLAEPDLTLDKALEIALAMEAAEKNIQQLNSTELSVQQVSTPKPHKGGSGHSVGSHWRPTRRGQQGQQTCFRCGSPKHKADRCRHKDTVCHGCHKVGHLIKVNIYGVKKFHKYVYGCPFVLVTDHKLLTTVFHPSEGIPPLSATRLQRWALTLSALSYTIEFKRTQDHTNADALSRLPRKSKLRGEESEVEHASCFNVSQIEALPVTASQLGRATRKDPILSCVMQHMRQGWPLKCPVATLQPYWNRRQELSIVGDCLLWGSRVIIPTSCHVKILQDLHREHAGMSRMKAIARSYFWWPSLDKAIESIVSSCGSC